MKSNHHTLFLNKNIKQIFLNKFLKMSENKKGKTPFKEKFISIYESFFKVRKKK
jgi:hypothetical protein